MTTTTVLSNTSRLALGIVEKALSVSFGKEVTLRDCTITMYDPWAHKFEDGAQIRQGVLQGNLWLCGNALVSVYADLSVFVYSDGRPACIPPGNRMTIEVGKGADRLLFYAIWQKPGALKVGNANTSPISWTYTEGYVKDYMDC